MSSTLFVGYEDQENLGLRSIVAVAESRGVQVDLMEFTPGAPEAVLDRVKSTKPDLIGFSIIFQFSLDDFADLMKRLRAAGCKAHFTVGGHFPSLRPEEVLQEVPEIDSVVRFEGEFTTLELIEAVRENKDLEGVRGVAFRDGLEIVINPPRPLIDDLDSIPAPRRDKLPMLAHGVPMASVLASRGCVYDCSFCSIRQFYAGAPGPLRRSRSVSSVVHELEGLVFDRGVRLVIFQDDDFAAKSPRQRRWISEFLDLLAARKLDEQMRWKISCRVDDVDEELIAGCRDRGLVAVYLGVESGSPTGLRVMNKRVTVAQNLRAIEILKRAEIAFEMGFMLFDPASTIETVGENLEFLRHVTADGSCVLNFCKMLPYAGTPIEEMLRAGGRLKGTLCHPDYEFDDERIGWLAFFVANAFEGRNFGRSCLVEQLRSARFDHLLLEALDGSESDDAYRRALVEFTMRCNLAALDTLDRALAFVARRSADGIAADWEALEFLTSLERSSQKRLQDDLDDLLSLYSPELSGRLIESSVALPSSALLESDSVAPGS